MSTSTSTSTCNSKGAEYLPVGFQPNDKICIIGRGKRHSNHPGNLRFQTFVREEMGAYSAAQSKQEKSAVISRVIDRVRADGAFVRLESATKRWLLVEEHAVSNSCFSLS